MPLLDGGPDPAKRGTRLSIESLPGSWRAFCIAERPDLDPERVFASFKDYWIARPGKDGRKLDWFATWRHWVRKERQDYGHTTGKKAGRQRRRHPQAARWPCSGRSSAPGVPSIRRLRALRFWRRPWPKPTQVWHRST
jgi:hypothetical protein